MILVLERKCCESIVMLKESLQGMMYLLSTFPQYLTKAMFIGAMASQCNDLNPGDPSSFGV